jgi:hypothetical protein
MERASKIKRDSISEALDGVFWKKQAKGGGRWKKGRGGDEETKGEEHSPRG